MCGGAAAVTAAHYPFSCFDSPLEANVHRPLLSHAPDAVLRGEVEGDQSDWRQAQLEAARAE